MFWMALWHCHKSPDENVHVYFQSVFYSTDLPIHSLKPLFVIIIHSNLSILKMSILNFLSSFKNPVAVLDI